MHYYNDELTVYGLIRDLFIAASITCFLWAIQMIARAQLLGARVKAYDELEEAYTPEEREELIHHIKRETFR